MSNSNSNNPNRTELAEEFAKALAPHKGQCPPRQARRMASLKSKVRKAMNSSRPTQRGHPKRRIDWNAEDATLHGCKVFGNVE